MRKPYLFIMAKQNKPLDILVIDDDPSVLLSLKVIIGKNHNITDVSSCKEAIDDYILKKPYDIVFSDLDQKPKDGVDVIKAVKENTYSTEIYIVTGTTGSLADEAKKIVGEDHFIEKPFSSEKIYNALSKAQKKYRS